MLQIKDYLVSGDNVRKMVTSTKTSGEFDKDLPDTIVIHYTAGPYQSSLNTLVNPKVKASAHVLIDRDGSITQMIPFNEIAWHAGESSWKGRNGLNKYSIGIEIVNSGPLTKSGNVYRSWFGAAYNPSDVVEAIHRNQSTAKYWHVYTAEQIETVRQLCAELIEAYPNIRNIVGHEEIAPGRKTDPGPAFPLDKLREQLLGADTKSDGSAEIPETGRVAAKTLNIRNVPESDGQLIAQPLPKGTMVSIVDEKNGWYKVRTTIEGWVFGKYIDVN
ncbi:MAG: N-acetylmuramoyl-L-alanine amidase [Bacteroidales bacterium]|jgi:N-acetylmuramoyl-L-alanine amidase|nr:N-acetylmuramoyl-L-alanine amidase [Bacteroidales bacterium]